MQPLTARRRAAPHDPAPSRWAYRMHRLWLTPLFRRLLRVGLPLFVAVFVLTGYFGNAQRREAIVNWGAGLRHQIESRPEFMVTMMAIDGASAPLAQAIRETVDLSLPQSSFDLNLDALRHQIEGLDAVASAHLQVKSGGVLQVTINERMGAVVWRSRIGLEMLDATGHRVAALVDRGARADLPLIAGDGADRAVPEALALIAAAGPLKMRLRGLVRMGGRRWNLVLDRDQTIELPETDPIPALERVIALDHAQDLLARDISVVDMRNPERPTLRLGPAAVEDLKRMRQSQAGAKSL